MERIPRSSLCLDKIQLYTMPIRRRILAEDSVLLRKEQLKQAKTRSVRRVKSVTLKKL